MATSFRAVVNDPGASPPARPRKASVAAIAIGVIGMLFGAPSLAFPFGRDQALFYVVGREWARSGAVPYRDTFDLKPPFIYAVHAACVLVFGEGMWPIRLVEWLIVVPLFGVAAASLGSPAAERTPKHRLALGVLGAQVLYYGFFNFWETAQCELWCAAATVGALWVALRARLPWGASAAIAGVLAGLAFGMKPPAGLMVLVVIVLIVMKQRGDRWRAAWSVAIFGVASIGVLGATVLVFARSGALADLVDVVFNYNRAYVAGDREVTGIVDGLVRAGYNHHDLDPWSSVVHVLVVVGLARGGLDGRDRASRSRWALAAALLVSGAIGVFVQAKFYRYHFGLLLAGDLLALVLVASDMDRMLAPSKRRSAALTASILGLFALSFPQSHRWAKSTEAVLAHVTGSQDRAWFLGKFALGGQFFYAKDREEVGTWIREHSNPDDRILVRGFEPTIYVYARRWYGGRFVTTHHLNSHKVLYKREEWLAQDRRDIDRIKPRFVVALQGRPDMDHWPDPEWIDSEPFFEALGYRRVHSAYEFVVMERSAPEAH